MKLVPGIDFTNTSQETFKGTDQESAKRQSRHQCCFALLGSLCVKAVRQMLVKLISDLEVDSSDQCSKTSNIVKQLNNMKKRNKCNCNNNYLESSKQGIE